MKKVAAAALLLLLASCTHQPQRMGYDRNLGQWAEPVYRTPKERAEQVSRPVERDSKKSPSTATTAKSDNRSLEKVIQPWMGTPYLYGGQTRKGTDCSGFVQRVMQEWAGVALPRSADEMSKVGKKISASNLRAGDAVFFGQWNKITHVGIAVDNKNFVHASTSKGVIVTPLDDSYWVKRYKGARRF